MFDKVLIANRGEIARRIIRTLKRMKIASVAVYSDPDRFTPAVLEADEHVRLGPAPASESYLNVDAVVAACKATGAQAVHPGYGFLSENVNFAERLAAEGIAFIGPRPEHLRAFGLKHTARDLAKASGVPMLEGTDLLRTVDEAIAAAERIGYPIMLKSTAGGGGIGMVQCADADELRERFAAVERTAKASFGDARVFMERFVSAARHVEVQIFGNGQGRVVALGERDCSLQRRNQKVIEETPAPGLSRDVRERLHAAAVRLGESVAYASAGTVEFIYDAQRQDFAFLEVNTRLQVEHPVTESVYGIDLVEWMIRQAAGEDPTLGAETLIPKGASIEARLYAETPHANFQPSAGQLTEVRFPDGVRVDGWITTGAEVTPFYDPMLAKIIVHAEDRPAALKALKAALEGTAVSGIETNLDYLRTIVASDLIEPENLATTALRGFGYQPRGLEVVTPGAQSSLQELPGRLGLWHVGVPPSGPMDSWSFRRANQLVGNPPDTCALECTVMGPTLRFHTDTTFAVSGGAMRATLDGEPIIHDVPYEARAGQMLGLGAIEGPGQRAYLAVRGGFAAPLIFGSRATFSLGAFGGHATGVLKGGDILHIDTVPEERATAPLPPAPLTHEWTLDVLYGPHGAPDFFRDEDIETLFSHAYEVHFNSARTGVRLTGPAPQWARPDGGEAGLHPSNLHDNAYAIGAIDFTGDMPILLGPDGPSLGGFVCPAVVAKDDLWKLGQLKPGDKVSFRAVARVEDERLATPNIVGSRPDLGSPILAQNFDGELPVVYRRQGDENILVEYGPMALDIALRLRVQLLNDALAAQKSSGIIDITPGIRSLQLHYDSTQISRAKVLDLLREVETGLPRVEDAKVSSPIVHLPLSWNDPQAELAMRKYQELVRPNAPWCPSNIEFIRRINGLADEAEVKRIIFDAQYLVLGLGDVYLGAPVATPVDPRHRLVTTKYNPARTWTPENAVGIGGAYMCIYGMEGPGGYQLFGRTIQVWNTWRKTKAFAEEPWLLRFFDRIRFFPVDHQELMEARAAFPHGAYDIKIEEATFSYADYAAGLARDADSIAAAKRRQQTAFDVERERWKAEGLDSFFADESTVSETSDIPSGCHGVASTVPGNVWKIVAEPGMRIAAGDTIAILESMKMEIAVTSPVAGRVLEIRAAPGRTVRQGDVIAILEDA